MYRYSYAMNENFESVHANKPAWIPPKVKSTQIRNPSAKILLVDQDENTVDDGLFGPGNGDLTSTGNKDLLAVRHDKQKVPETTADRTKAIRGHPNAERRGNVAFVDGHGEFVFRTIAYSAESILVNK